MHWHTTDIQKQKMLCLVPLNQIQGSGYLGCRLSKIPLGKGQGIAWMVHQFIKANTEKQSRTLILTPAVNLKWPINLMRMFLDGETKLEYLVRTYKNLIYGYPRLQKTVGINTANPPTLQLI